MRSWRKSATSKFRNIAQRCAVSLPSLNPALPCLIETPPVTGRRRAGSPRCRSRPALPPIERAQEIGVDPHAERQPHLGENRLDLLDRFRAQVLDVLEILVGL